MKKAITLAVLGAVFTSLAVSVREIDESAGFNGGFEVAKKGLPVNWYLYGPKLIENGDVKIELDTEDFAEGKQSLKLIAHKADPVGGNRSAGLFQVLYPVKTGKPYKVSFWLKNQGCTVRVIIKNERGHSHRGLTEAEKKDRAAHPPITKTFGEEETGTDTWRQFEYIYVVPETDGTIRFQLNVIEAGTLWIDDVRIEEEKPANGSLVDEPEVTVLTPKAVTNLAAQTDRLAVAGDIYTFSQLLSKDLTVTYAMSPDPDELPQEYDREEYLAMMRESHCFYSNRLCKTSIGKIDISPGAQQADVENTVVQECISRGDGSVIRVTVSEKVTLRIENGKVKIAKLAGIVMKTNFEQD